MLVDSIRWRTIRDARLASLEEGGLLRVMLGKQPILFVRHEGTLRAMYDRCPHQGRALSGGWVDKGHVVCPFHRFHFDPATGACRGGLTVNVETFPVQEENGVIKLGKPYTTLRIFGFDLW